MNMKMMYVAAILFVAMMNQSCSRNEKFVSPNPEQVGKVTIFFTEMPPAITKIVAAMTRYGYEPRSITLTISDTASIASGTFNNITIGLWHLRVDAYDDSNIVRYSGETDVEVLPDQVTIVDLTLLSNTGTVEVHVHWGYQCTPLPSGCVSWWTADSNANDIIGGNNGTFEGGGSIGTGKVDKGFRFDGIDDRIIIPDTESLKLSDSFTIEGWMYIESIPETWGRIIIRGVDNALGLNPYSLYLASNGALGFTIYSQPGVYETIFTTISAHKFYHFAATLDSTSGAMRLYLDGNLAASTFTTLRPMKELDSNANPGIGIGNMFAGSAFNQPFHGIIDELSIYERALSSAEIRAIYLSGSGGKCR